VGAVLVPNKQGNGTISFEQPEIILIYKGQQYKVPLKCLYFDGSDDGAENGQLVEFGSGYNGCFRIIPAISQGGTGNIVAAGLFLSERVRRTFMANYYTDNVPLAVYGGGMVGPIKIWEVKYPSNIKFRSEYLNTTWPARGLYAID
ncbi:hypothetical protein HYT58_01795, partial [Candidatus Woesearchaeota archaeon]|nr:hypothetical protein [Candidatus Woesearchaeota archaeon]